ncbi:MAG: pyrroline-5-carboxylate reductase [Acidobacteria bacterium]|nr:MAG: pyrroline-5-carboxylate reductase [Acidobacteriota bacterium]
MQNLNKRVAVLGLGKMGGILLQAFLEKGLISRETTYGTDKYTERAEALGKEFGIRVSADNAEAARCADVILLCVKPQTVKEVVEVIRPELNPGKLIISIAASVPSSYIENLLEAEIPVVRCMPNTPCVVGCGMTGICKGRYADQGHLELAKTLFEAVGRAVIVDEKHMDAVTGLSASGPAYIYVILESLAEAGVKVGLPRDVATLLAAQTALGASKVVLETGHHPALLKDAVTTPAGCTIDGLLELEEGKLRVTLIKAVVRATQRAKELLMCE